jgi:hypothetical protein
MVAVENMAPLQLQLKVLVVVAIQEFSWMPQKLSLSLSPVAAVALRPVLPDLVFQVVVAQSAPHQPLAQKWESQERFLQVVQAPLLQIALRQPLERLM